MLFSVFIVFKKYKRRNSVQLNVGFEILVQSFISSCFEANIMSKAFILTLYEHLIFISAINTQDFQSVFI